MGVREDESSSCIWLCVSPQLEFFKEESEIESMITLSSLFLCLYQEFDYNVIGKEDRSENVQKWLLKTTL